MTDLPRHIADLCGVVLDAPRPRPQRIQPSTRVEEEDDITTIYLDNRPLGWITRIRRGEYLARTIRGQRISTNSKQLAINFLHEENQ
jgi:hypothetical protein